MKIDEDSTLASTSAYADMPPASAKLLKNIRNAKTTEEFIIEINKGREVHSVMGKTELCRWVEVLNRCDEILETATKKDTRGEMFCDHDVTSKRHSISVIRFTVLLFECTSSRRVYRSMDRVLALMESTDMEMLAEVLRLLQTMGKRSKYLTQRVQPADQATLVHNLTAIAQCWGGKLRSVKMAECVKKEPNLPALFPFTYTDSKQRSIVVEKLENGDSVAELVKKYMVQMTPTSTTEAVSSSYTREDRYCLLARLRMLNGFDQWTQRFKCLIVRLLSVSTLIYCRCQSEENPISSLLYSDFVDELVALLKTEKETGCHKEYAMLDSIHTEALSTLCSIANYEKEPKIPQILEALSAGSYHGYLSVLTRQVVDELKNNNLNKPGKPSVALSTALFSFIYHLASIEPGGDTLVASGLTQTLLSVIGYHDLPIELITFGTRCARIIDLFTTIDVAAFKAHNGMEICVNRIVHEIDECRKEQPFVIDTSYDMPFEDDPVVVAVPVAANQEGEASQQDAAMEDESMTGQGEVAAKVEQKTEEKDEIKGGPWIRSPHTGLTCHQQRSGLIKGLLTFVKRAIQDPQFHDSIRHIMEGGLPEALMHILSNAEYYSPSLFHQSAQLITNYVYQNPDELSVLQRRHVPYVLYQSMLRKELPNSRDVISTIGAVFTAMCLNERGLKQFKSYEPFDQIFRILLSVKFLVSLKKKRNEMHETAASIGGALDELLRHYPDLKPQMLRSMIRVLDRLIAFGKNPPAKVDIVMALAKHVARNVVLHTTGSASAISPTSTIHPVVQALALPLENVVETRDDEQPMEMDEEYENEEEESDVDEEAEMSMDEMSGEGIVATNEPTSKVSEDAVTSTLENKMKPNASVVGLDMVCDDGNGRKILPLGDYMLISAKIIETMMTQQSNLRMIDQFVDMNGIEKMLVLCQLHCLHNEIALTTYSQSVANIVKFIVFQRNSDSSPTLMKSVMAAFSKTILPIFVTPPNQFPSLNQAESSSSAATESNTLPTSLMIQIGEKIIHNTLTNLNNILPVLMIISKSISATQLPVEVRHRVFETWKTPEGVRLYGMLRKLSRMLVWESSLIRVLKPSIRTCATQTDPVELSDPRKSGGVSAKNPNPVDVDVDSVEKEPKEKAWVAAGISQEEHDFWTQHKPLADLVTKTGRTVSDMVNLVARSITAVSNSSRRTRRQEGGPSAAATQCANMIFTSIYKDLKWTPKGPINSPMAYARYTDLLMQLGNALFDERRVGGNAIVQQFYLSGCHNAFFELFTEKLSIGVTDGGPNPALEDLILEWCRLAGRLANRNQMQTNEGLPSRHHRDRIGNTSEFDINKYLKLVYRDLFNAFTGLFDRLSAIEKTDLQPYQAICENSFSVFKEVVRNLTNDSSDTNGGNANRNNRGDITGAVRPADNSAAWPQSQLRNVVMADEIERPADDLDESQVQMLMEMGFSRDIVIQAIRRTHSTDEAANFLLTRRAIIILPSEIPTMFELQRNGEGGQPAGEATAQQNIGTETREGSGAQDGHNLPQTLNDIMNALPEVGRRAVLNETDGNRQEQIDRARVYFSDPTVNISEATRVAVLRAFQTAEEHERPVDIVMRGIQEATQNQEKSVALEDDDDDIAAPLIPPLNQLKIENEFSLQSTCLQLIPLIKRMLNISTELVFTSYELVLSMLPAMSVGWKRSCLITEIIGSEIVEMCEQMKTFSNIDGTPKAAMETAKLLSSRVHFSCLLFDHLADDYIDIAKETGLVDVLLSVVGYCEQRFHTITDLQSLLSRLILWLDLYDKNNRTVTRRRYLETMTKTLVWHYQVEEVTEGVGPRRREKKWTAYEPSLQSVLTDAFFAGKKIFHGVLKRSGRTARKVRIDLTYMEQIDANNSTRDAIRCELPSNVEVDVEKFLESEKRLTWSPEENNRLLMLTVQLLQKGTVHHMCAHSLLNFAARLTRNPENAVKFMEAGGIEYVMRLRSAPLSSSAGLLSIIISNCIDDETMLAYVFDKTIRKVATTPQVQMMEYLHPGQSKSIDWFVTLNKLMPLSARSPGVFMDVFSKACKMNGSSITLSSAEKEKTKKASNIPIASGAASTASSSTASEAPVQTTNNATAPTAVTPTELTTEAPATKPEMGATTTTAAVETYASKTNARVLNIIKMLLNEVLYGDFPVDPLPGHGRIINRDQILLIVAEIVMSHPSTAILVAESQDKGKSIILTLLEDYIYPSTDKVNVTPSLKTLISVIASSPNAKAQELVVQDVKGALQTFCEKAAAKKSKKPDDSKAQDGGIIMDEDEKTVAHRISELCSVIMTMCKSCSTEPPTPENRHRDKASGNIVKVFHKKKLCNDLVRSITFLHLGVKESIDAINQILKTLELLMDSAGIQATPHPPNLPIGTTRANVQRRRYNIETTLEHRAITGQFLTGTMEVDDDDDDDEAVLMRELDEDPDEELWDRLGEEMRNQVRERAIRAVQDRRVDEVERNILRRYATEELFQQQPRRRAVQQPQQNQQNQHQMIVFQTDENHINDGIQEEIDDDDVGANQAAIDQAHDAAAHNEDDDGEDEEDEEDEDEEEDEEQMDSDNEVEVIQPDESRNDENPTDHYDEYLGVQEQDHHQRGDDDDEDEDEDEDDDDDEDDREEEDREVEVTMQEAEQPGARREIDEADSIEEENDDFDTLEDEVNRIDDLELFESATISNTRPSIGFAEFLRNEEVLAFERRVPSRTRAGNVLQHPLLTRHQSEENPNIRAFTYRGGELMPISFPRILHRQNAIRRNPEVLTSSTREGFSVSEMISRAIGGANIGDGPGRLSHRPADGGPGHLIERIIDFGAGFPHSSIGFSRSFLQAGGEESQQKITVLTSLERLSSYVSIMEPVSIRYVCVVVNSLLTRKERQREAREKEIEKQKETESSKKKKTEAGVVPKNDQTGSTSATPIVLDGDDDVVIAAPSATVTTNTVSETTAPNASRNVGEDTATTQAVVSGVSAAPPAETAAPPAEVAPAPPAQPPNTDEPMDVTVSVAQVRPSPLSFPVEISVEQIEEQRQRLAAEIMAADEQARVAQEERAQEFRAILGDIEIPVGVDPAFLAALPEDMRAEVIRDYRRQQRAERAARPVVPQVPPNQQQQQPENREEAPVTTGTAAPVVDVGSGGAQNEPGNGAGAGAVTVPLIEPINAEFLNALPPELQEEVLAEHERRVREAEEAMRRANAPAAVVEHEMDGAAVIASLPANERAQVLAEMDEAELAELPVAMQEEARRARAQNLDSQMLRYHRLLFRRTPRNGVPTANRANNGLHAVIAGNSTVGLGAGTATQAHPSAPQLLDRDAIVILCLLYLMESKVSFNRLQKVIRNVCVNSNTCDFVIWCLLALLDKASDTNVDDEEFNSNVPNWLETVTVSGVGHNERALRIGEKLSKVSIHSMISVPLCRNVLDLLATIAKSYPGNFLPIALRVGTKPTDVAKQWPTFDMFWGMVQSNTKVPLRKEWQVPPEMQLEECAVGQLLMYLGKPAVARTSQLQDRIMKVASTIFQTLPDYSLKALKIKNENYMPLTSHLALVIDTMTKGSCTTEGLNDGLTLLAEAMRTFDESTAEFIFDKLFSAVAQLGNSLLPQISRLILELDEAQTSDIMTISTFEKKAGTSEPKKSKTSQLIVDTSNGGRVAHGRFDGERLIIDGEQNMRLMMSSCKELQLPAVTVLTDKAGAQYSLLSALQTLVKVRGHLKVIRADKRKKAKEMEKKKQKEEEEQRKKEEEEIAAVVAEFQNRNARLQAQAQTSQEGAPESTTETAPAPISEATSEPVQEATAASNQEATTAPVADAITEPVPEAITESAPEATTATATAPGATAATAPETTTAPVPQQEDETTEQSKKEEEAEDEEPPEIRISERLESLNPLWDSLSECLQRLGRASDPHAVLALQPAAEAFFLVHASQHKKEKKKEGEAGATPGAVSASSSSHEVGLKEEMDPDTKKLIEFAEKHREVLNQALRQNGAVLSTGGPFAILTHFPKLLDFDVKRRYFRKELTKSEPAYRRNDVSVQVNRNRVFSDSFRELYRIRPSAWKNRFYIIFQGEEGQDAGGLLREWFSVITKEIFNPNYALFITAPGDMVTYMINKASYINPEHLDYFKFVGRLIAKSVFEHKYLDCYFTRAFYKHILNVPVKYQDLESEDPAFFKSLKFLLENPIDELGLDLTFSTEVEEFGVRSVRDLKANGRQIEVTDANKDEYVQLICQMKMTGSIRKQLDAFLQGFYEIIPKDLIAMFNEQELELLISGLPTVDIDDLSANTDYKGYQKNSVQIQWFWRALRSFEKEDKAKFLQFVTGTSKVPLQGFASLEGMNGTQKFSIHLDSRGGDRLPAAHTCFNQLDLPQYESYEKLRDSLLLAIRECTEGFGFA